MAIKNITILGSGIMGHGIAQVSAMAGYKVTLRDIDQKFLDKAMEKIKWSLEKLTEKAKITRVDAEKYINNITPIIDLKDATKNADLVIEAVPEDFNLKKKVYRELEGLTDEKTIFASNTSTLPITELSSLTSRPEKFIGIHFFNPPQLMKLVEVIPGTGTDDIVTDELTVFVKSLNKQPVICKKDVSGFIVNRIFIPLVHEALYSLDRDNVSMETIDSAVKYKLDFPMGILELADYTGLDVIYKASSEMNSRDKLVMRMHPRVKELYDKNELGQKTGKGFYTYQGENYERIDLTPEKASQYDISSILGVAANNASWLLENEVCTKGDLDTALTLGMGLKTKIFELVSKSGTEKLVRHLEELEKKEGEFYKPNEYLRSIM
jgi:enoyl-CoA hydratase/3-hydroxyacyl-CoA dehydrogenase